MTPYVATKTALALAARLRPSITGQLRRIYDHLDLPVMPVLARMEQTGVLIEQAQLHALSLRMESEINRLTDDIYGLAGKPFNINSPKQMGEILFDDLKLPTQGKTGKTKAYSTAADVLEADRGVELHRHARCRRPRSPRPRP